MATSHLLNLVTRWGWFNHSLIFDDADQFLTEKIYHTRLGFCFMNVRRFILNSENHTVQISPQLGWFLVLRPATHVWFAQFYLCKPLLWQLRVAYIPGVTEFATSREILLWMINRRRIKWVFQLGNNLSAIEHVIQNTLFYCLPINVASTRIYTFIRWYTDIREEWYQVTHPLYLSQRGQKWLAHRTWVRLQDKILHVQCIRGLPEWISWRCISKLLSG